MTAALVFARMDSARLPGKVLLDLGGRPMLQRVLDRVGQARQVDQVILATSDRQVDDPIAELGARLGIEVFRGAGEDVMGRALACCEHLGLGAFARISGDSPFVAPEVIDAVCTRFAVGDADLATNVFPRSFPPGCSVEVLDAGAVARAYADATAAEHEHVTAVFYRAAERFSIVNHTSGKDYGGVRLTVDTLAELTRARLLIEDLGPALDTRSLDVIAERARALLPEEAGALP